MSTVSSLGATVENISLYTPGTVYANWGQKDVVKIMTMVFLDESYSFNANHTYSNLETKMRGVSTFRALMTQRFGSSPPEMPFMLDVYSFTSNFLFMSFRFRYVAICISPYVFSSDFNTSPQLFSGSNMTMLMCMDFGTAWEATGSYMWANVIGTMVRLRSDLQTVTPIGTNSNITPAGLADGNGLKFVPATYLSQPSPYALTNFASGSDLSAFRPRTAFVNFSTDSINYPSGVLSGLDADDYQAAPVRATLTTPSAFQIANASSLLDNRPAPILRTVPRMSLNMSPPAVVGGKPVSPVYWAKPAHTITGSADFAPDRSPLYDSVNHNWIVQPPTGGVGDYWWVASQMPGSTGIDQRIGEPTDADGSTGQLAAYNNWPEAPHPNSQNQTLNSFYPFKPKLTDYYHFNADSSFYAGRGMKFRRQSVQHFFSSLSFTGSYTVIAVMASLTVENALPTQYVYAQGKDIRTLGYTGTTQQQAQDGFVVPTEYNSANNYQIPSPGMSYGQTEQKLYDGQPPRVEGRAMPQSLTCAVPNPGLVRPKMLISQAGGGQGFVANYSPWGKYVRTGSIRHSGINGLLVGRAGGIVKPSFGSTMLLFELRIWKRSLSYSELNAQYNQLSATYKFGSYE